MFRLILEVTFCGLIVTLAVIALNLVELGSAFFYFHDSVFYYTYLWCCGCSDLELNALLLFLFLVLCTVQIELNFFDTVASSTAALVPCSNPVCTYGVQGAAAQCSPQVNQCSYTFQYEDGSGTSGVYVSDALYFDMILGQSTSDNVNSSATIIFG